MSIVRAALFAGQGSQAVGMGKDLFAASPACADLFRKADDALGYALSEILFNGPIERLTRTDVCQPAIFTMSAAAFAYFRECAPTAEFSVMAGLSLGEWTALWAAGAVSFEEALRILEARGRFMQEACEATPSGMVTLLKVGPEVAEEVAAATGCAVTNYNGAMQTVLGGTHEQVDEAAKLAATKGARAVILQTAGAYHSPFMAPAAEKLAPILAKADIRAPRVPVLSNYTGALHGGPDEIRAAMLAQIANPVRLTANTAALSSAGVTAAVEFGPGAVLTGLLKRALPSLALFNANSAASAASAAQAAL